MRLKALAAPVVPHFSTLSMLCCVALNFHFITMLKKFYSEKKQKNPLFDFKNKMALR